MILPWLVAVFLGLQCLRIIYRLCFHPLSRFPGPKLAAATSLYGAYWTLRGEYTLVLPKLHQKYGQIVRTYPNELHIHDVDAYNEVFSVGTRFDKMRRFYDHPLMEGSHFNMSDLNTSMSRRDKFAPFLTKEAVARGNPLIHTTVMKFIDILGEYGRRNKIVDLTRGYHSLTTDVIMNYGWQRKVGALDFPGFAYPSVVYMSHFLVSTVLIRTFHDFFRPIVSFALQLPILAKLDTMLAAVFHLRTQARSLALDAINRPKLIGNQHTSIFDRILQPDPKTGLPLPSINDLTAEALALLVGGEQATANTLIHGTFHVLNNPQIKRRLQQEVSSAILDGQSMPNADTLEKLPYLRAVLKESLRISHGVPGRMPRVVPPSGVRLCGNYIPPGTILSLSQYVYNIDSSVFPDPQSFKPERWLGDDFEYLDRHLVTFSKGSRGCIGINLAYSELYIAFAYIFRYLDMQLYETTSDDMKWGDYFAPITRKHLEVKVLSSTHLDSVKTMA